MSLLFCLGLALLWPKGVYATDCTSLKTDLATPSVQAKKDETLHLALTTFSDLKSPSERKLVLKRKFTGLNDEKVFVRVIAPSELMGLTILSYLTNDQITKQWIYSPELQSVKRIVDSQRKSNFAGSEFTFEDLRPHTFTHQNCLQILSESNTHILSEWEDQSLVFVAEFSKAPLQLTRIDFFDEHKNLTRKAQFLNYTNNPDYPARPQEIHITTLKNKRTSVLKLSQIQTHTSLNDAEFNLKALTR